MQTLMQALKDRFGNRWPEGNEKFSVDPDGEVRGDIVSDDFYPEIPIHHHQRDTDFGREDGILVTKEQFEAN